MSKLVLFDLDGTLLDTSLGIINSVKYTINILNLKELPYRELLTFIGPPIQISFMNHYSLDDKTAQKATDIFRKHYSEETLFEAEIYADIPKVCRTLIDKGYTLGVATYKREDYAIRLLHHFGFDKYMNIMCGADNENKLKKKDIVKKCIDKAGIDESEVVLVGDTMNDAIAASECGIDFVGVSYGFGFNNQKTTGHTIIDNPMQLICILRGLGRVE